MQSEYYTTWEAYVKAHPEVEDAEVANEIQTYEEGMYRYIFSLFL